MLVLSVHPCWWLEKKKGVRASTGGRATLALSSSLPAYYAMRCLGFRPRLDSAARGDMPTRDQAGWPWRSDQDGLGARRHTGRLAWRADLSRGREGAGGRPAPRRATSHPGSSRAVACSSGHSLQRKGGDRRPRGRLCQWPYSRCRRRKSMQLFDPLAIMRDSMLTWRQT